MKIDSSLLKAEILMAIGHSNRIRIIEYLTDGPRCACEIAKSLNIEQSNLSRHMKILTQAEILHSWKEGQKVMYEIANKKLIKVLDDVSSILKDGLKNRMKVLEEL
jgi:ArsR family transcriptional regulator